MCPLASPRGGRAHQTYLPTHLSPLLPSYSYPVSTPPGLRQGPSFQYITQYRPNIHQRGQIGTTLLQLGPQMLNGNPDLAEGGVSGPVETTRGSRFIRRPFRWSWHLSRMSPECLKAPVQLKVDPNGAGGIIYLIWPPCVHRL